jgi:hypothetical protein
MCLALTRSGEGMAVLDSLVKPLNVDVRCYQTQVDSSPDKVREKVQSFKTRKSQILHIKTTMPAVHPSSGAPHSTAGNEQSDGRAFAGRRAPMLTGGLQWSDPSTTIGVERTYHS